MKAEVVTRLRCPACGASRLASKEFLREADEILEGVVWCEACRSWFPVEEGFLDFSTGSLAYAEERKRFSERREAELSALGLPVRPAGETGQRKEHAVNVAQALAQRHHFDWYASNEEQRYSEYEATPFWRAADRIAFEPWKAEIAADDRAGRWLMDVGCAQGRSTFQVMDLDLNVVGFDISRKCIQEAARRYREGKGKYRARASFIVADGSVLPLRDATFDYALIYGVLHHLSDPGEMCREVGRVLKPEGVYFGQENNVTFFRALFELTQKVWPIWHEEAGPEALVSSSRLTNWLEPAGFRVSTRTSVFVPPHVINWTNEAAGFRILRAVDRVMTRLPWVGRNGGLIIFEARRP